MRLQGHRFLEASLLVLSQRNEQPSLILEDIYNTPEGKERKRVGLGYLHGVEGAEAHRLRAFDTLAPSA